MIARNALLGALGAACLWPLPAPAADFDGSKPFTCALLALNSCTAGGECEQETPDSAAIPRFLFVDVQQRRITGRHEDGQNLATPIEQANKRGQLLVLDGAEGGLSWTVTVDQATGAMSLSAIGTDLGFLVFGSCVRAAPN